MRLLPVVAIGTVAALALGGAAYAAAREEEEPPLPVPDKDVCSTSSDVGQATSEILADDSVDAEGLRKAADVLRNWTTYCDDAAEETGKASIILLEAKADLYEKARADLPLPAATPPQAPAGPGSLWPVPPGYVGLKHTYGLHGEPGMVYWYENADQWFFPDNTLLVPYYIPGGSIKTQGDCEGCSHE